MKHFLSALYLASFLLSLQANNINNNNINDEFYDILSPLLNEPKCSNLVHKQCKTNNFFDCLQSLPIKVYNNLVSVECQHKIWRRIANLTQNTTVLRHYLNTKCVDDLKRNSQCESIVVNSPENGGEYFKCITTNYEQLENSECKTALVQIKRSVFQDLLWTVGFFKQCTIFVERYNCGRYTPLHQDQSETIQCLEQRHQLNRDCKREIEHITKITNEIRTQIYHSCLDDWQNTNNLQHNTINGDYLNCASVPGTSVARLFSCLSDGGVERLTRQCRRQLVHLKLLVAPSLSRGLMRACRDDIKKSHCKKQIASIGGGGGGGAGVSGDKNVRLVQVLLCLENAAKNGTKLDLDCEVEIADHRKVLMEDYRLSPEIVDGCKKEISVYCSGIETNGKTIHCLMEHARARNVNKRIGNQCQRALEILVKETDVGEDWRVDPVLHNACYSVVKVACSDKIGGDARVMSCLLDNLDSDHMTDECEDALLQIQYFVARNFQLDPQLYRECREDAVQYCHATRAWQEDASSGRDSPTYTPQVLPCLYRLAFQMTDSPSSAAVPRIQIKHSCLAQIQRVMRQRAVSVDLQPEIEEVCFEDLAFYCLEKNRRGEEMRCLQSNLDELKSDKCREAVAAAIEIEAEHTAINPYIAANCKREMDIFCAAELRHDHGDLFECLKRHKNDAVVRANLACRQSIEHFQIISLKHYKFSSKFKNACKSFVGRFCAKSRNLSEVVYCLSEKVTKDTVQGLKSDITKECRQQLRAQIFQSREKIDYNGRLKAACASDIKEFCANVEQENSQVLECLQGIHDDEKKKLTHSCHTEIFKIKKQDQFDNNLDYALLTSCASTIDTFCPHVINNAQSQDSGASASLLVATTGVLNCLKEHRNERGFAKKCRQVVMHRLLDQDTNFELNPGLQQHCTDDIAKFCTNKNQKGGLGGVVGVRHAMEEGVIINCLKVAFRKSSLSDMCEKEIVSILREQALDLELNPLVRTLCKNEISTICKSQSPLNEDAAIGGEGRVEECLKNALINNKIPTPECREEVANLIEYSHADINADPILQSTCALDLLTHCKEIPQGNGRHLRCLKRVFESSNKRLLTDECRSMLNKRFQMYENAGKLVAPLPENIQELLQQVSRSPSVVYFMLWFLVILTPIFIAGILTGHAIKHKIALKNK